MHERQREVKAALHPSRVPADSPVSGLGEADALEQCLRPPATLGAGQALQRGLEHQVLAAGEDRVERGLLEGGADHGAHLSALPDDVESTNGRAAARRRQQRREHQHGRRLPGAVRPEETVDLTGRDREVDSVNCAGALAKLPHQVLYLDRRLAVHALHSRQGAVVSLIPTEGHGVESRPRRSPRDRIGTRVRLPRGEQDRVAFMRSPHELSRQAAGAVPGAA